MAAGEAPPDRRIQLRDPIAAHGSEAISRLMASEWIGDPKYAAFAIRTITRAAELGEREAAVTALIRASSIVTSEHHRADLAAALLALGHATRPTKPRTSIRARPWTDASMAVEDLVVGTCYRRRDLHLAGLGGNWQTGISYPADGTYCLLFSDPSKASDYGYRDAPVGEDGYRYFGRWDGTGDMTLAGGNQAVLDRSPELYLFTEADCGQVYRGRFECLGWEEELATRDGQQHKAIVFRLQRAPQT
jgi:hypothetical protein